MHLRKCSGYAVYPLFAALLFGSLGLRAQDTQTQQQGNPTPGTQQPGSMTPDESSSQQNNVEQRAQVLREAQQRVNARRKQRIKQIIQDTYSHKYDVYFGAGYLRFRPGSSLQHMNEAAWDIGMVDWLHGNWGVAADVRGYYGSAYTGTHVGNGIAQVYQPSISQYVFLAGPQYRFFKGQHWGWTGQVLAGAGHGNFGTGTGGLPPQLVGLYKDSTVLNVSAGASVDYNLSPALAIRLTPNALVTRYGGEWQQNLGWNVGVLYRFGRK